MYESFTKFSCIDLSDEEDILRRNCPGQGIDGAIAGRRFERCSYRQEGEEEEEDGQYPPPRFRTTEEMRRGINGPPPLEPLNDSPLRAPWTVLFGEERGVACPVYDLSSFDPVLYLNYDGMHTIGGVVKDTVLFSLQGLRQPNERVKLHDARG